MGSIGAIGSIRDIGEIGDIGNTKTQFDGWFLCEGGISEEGMQSTGFLRRTLVSILPERNIEIQRGENEVQRLAGAAEGQDRRDGQKRRYSYQTRKWKLLKRG